MECSCYCGSDSGDQPELYRESLSTAKKVYRCCECGEDIKPGETYHRADGKWLGEWKTYRTCLPCSQIRSDYCGDGWIFGELRAAIWDCLDFDYVTGEDKDGFRNVPVSGLRIQR